MLFGEKAEITEVNSKDWAHVVCLFDGYSGWCRKSQLALLHRKEFHKETRHMVASNTSRLLTEHGEMWLPLGSELTGLKGGTIKLIAETAHFKGTKIAFDKLPTNAETLCKAAFQYLHAPYQWGGRTVAGIDCSGLTQMAFKMANFALLRDAHQQAQQGVLVEFLQETRAGDVAFFEDRDGKIIHVGLLLGNNTIIHASDNNGRVAVDKIDQGGIVSISLKKRTHNLRFVKRMFNL